MPYYPDNIPKEWATEVGWCTHVNKRPLVKPNRPFETTTLTYTSNFGFITSDLNDICIIDVDDEVLQDLPDDLQQLAAKTYTEQSLSGKGLHIVFRLEHKTSVATSRSYVKAPVGTFKGQLSLRNNFMVTTGAILPTSPAALATLSEPPDTFRLQLEHLAQTAALRATIDPAAPVTAEAEARLRDQSTQPAQAQAPGQVEVRTALKLLKLDQSHMVKRAYEAATGNQYEHYTYWLTMAMALHAWGTEAKQATVAYSMFLDWSKTDKASFKSEDDVEAKWRSLSAPQPQSQAVQVTWRTMMAIASFLAFDYPRKEYKSGKQLANPQTNEYVNFAYLLDRYNIVLYSAGGSGYYLKGDEDILQRYFNAPGTTRALGYYGPYTPQGLAASALKMCQDSNWRKISSMSPLVNVWLNSRHQEVDLFKAWLDTPEADLDDEFAFTPTFKGRKHISDFTSNSTFEYVNSCIQWNTANQREALSSQMLYKTFMQLIKFRTDLELPFDDNGGMLAFIGPENTRKTTFFKMLMPKPLAFAHKIVNMQLASDKGLRDFIRYLGQRVIVQIDEFEGFMNHAKMGPVFKSIISGNNVSFTDIYQTEETQMTRKAIIVGTSNESRHVLSHNGSRRMWLAEVNGIDTNRLLEVNWHAFYRQMYKEFDDHLANNQLPWLMNTTQVAETTSRNESLSSVNDVDIMLAELFPYSQYFELDQINQIITSIQSDKSGHLYTTTEVDAKLRFRGYTVKLSNLERALERFCMKYINTTKTTIVVPKPKCVIKYGRVHQGERSDGQFNYRKWIMPRCAD